LTRPCLARFPSTAQGDRLAELGVVEDRIYLDHGLTGTNRRRPGLDQALAAVRAGDTLVVPKLDRLARSVPDARAIGEDVAARGIKLSLGGQPYDPEDPMGKMFFNILATFAEFEVDLLRMRTREGMAVARAKGRLRGKAAQAQPKATGRAQPDARQRRLPHHRPGRVVLYLPAHRVPLSPAAAGGDQMILPEPGLPLETWFLVQRRTWPLVTRF
jgi:DNA invertase Pin-like site-specific DNA recombinase